MFDIRLRHRKNMTTWSANAINRKLEELVNVEERNYFKSLPYLLPYDRTELSRQSLQYNFFFKRNRGPLHYAPIDSVNKLFILDLGGGAGLWGEGMAKYYLNAEVVNLDAIIPLDDSKPEVYNRPVNYMNVQQNFLKPINFNDGYFDYVHMGFTGLAIPETQWHHVFSEMVRLVSKGGWIEIIDFGPLENINKHTMFYHTIINGLAKTKNITYDKILDIGAMFPKLNIVPSKHETLSIQVSLNAGHPNNALARSFVEQFKTICSRVKAEDIFAPDLVDLGFDHFYESFLTYEYTLYVHTYYGMRQ